MRIQTLPSPVVLASPQTGTPSDAWGEDAVQRRALEDVLLAACALIASSCIFRLTGSVRLRALTALYGKTLLDPTPAE